MDGRLLCPDHVVEEKMGATTGLVKFGDAAGCSPARRCEVDGCNVESTLVTVLVPLRGRGVHPDQN